MRNYYHVYTKGLDRGLLYRDDADFCCGMNDIPVCLTKVGAELLCFFLMPNHVHFVFFGEESDCITFINEFKRRTARRLRAVHSEVNALKDVEVGIKLVGDDYYRKIGITYVLKNPVVANLGYMHSTYPWSSGNLYFNPDLRGHFRTVGDFQVLHMREFLKSKVTLPSEYLIDNERPIIHPKSYINTRRVEELYGSPRKMHGFLSLLYDGEFEVWSGMAKVVHYKTGQIKSLMLRVCRDDYDTEKFDNLNIDDKYRVGLALKTRYGVSPNQFARVTGLDSTILESMSEVGQ